MNRRILSIVLGLIFVLSAVVFSQDDTGISNEAKMEFNAGNKAFKEGKTDLALEKYKAAVAQDPNFALAFYWMGNVYKKERDYVNAAKSYENAIQKDGFMEKLGRLFNRGQYLNSEQAGSREKFA